MHILRHLLIILIQMIGLCKFLITYDKNSYGKEVILSLTINGLRFREDYSNGNYAGNRDKTSEGNQRKLKRGDLRCSS